MGPFGTHALELMSWQLAVIPISRDRTPAVSCFNKWSRPPAPRTVARWVDVHAALNIAIIPGLSDLWVADADDADAEDAVQELLGPTPLRVQSSRGMHFYYRKVAGRVPTSLRAHGLNVDLKTGNSLVIAPPSVHTSGKIYALAEGCDWSAVADLPVPKLDALRRLVEKPLLRAEVRDDRSGMRDGSRKQWLNDKLCAHAAACDTEADLLDVARTLNEGLADRGSEPLPDDVVVARTAQVWKDAEAGHLKPWIGRNGVARTDKAEMDSLATLNTKTAADALMLLLRLRIEHSARCLRGDTFTITPKAMSDAEVIPGWKPQRYRTARDLLLRADLLEEVSPFSNTRGGRQSAQYRLPEARRRANKDGL